MKKIYVEFGHLELEGDEEKYTKFEDKLDELSDKILDELSGESVEPSGNKRIDEIISEMVDALGERIIKGEDTDEVLSEVRAGTFIDLTKDFELFEIMVGDEPTRTKKFITQLIEKGFKPEPVLGTFGMHCEGFEPVEIVKLFRDLRYEGEIHTMNEEDDSDYTVWEIKGGKILKEERQWVEIT